MNEGTAEDCRPSVLLVVKVRQLNCVVGDRLDVCEVFSLLGHRYFLRAQSLSWLRPKPCTPVALSSPPFKLSVMRRNP